MFFWDILSLALFFLLSASWLLWHEQPYSASLSCFCEVCSQHRPSSIEPSAHEQKPRKLCPKQFFLTLFSYVFWHNHVRSANVIDKGIHQGRYRHQAWFCWATPWQKNVQISDPSLTTQTQEYGFKN